MAERFEINEEALEDVVGGSLIWSKKGVYCKEEPTITYSFSKYSECKDWIQNNWKGKPQDNSCLKALCAAGLITPKN